MMQSNDVYLLPGDFHFGGPHICIRTVLGSCVAMVFWHPKRRIGGMCHYMLPERLGESSGRLDGRYAEDALALFVREIHKSGTRFNQYHVRMVGAGNMFPSVWGIGKDAKSVSQRNISKGLKLLEQHGIVIQPDYLGGIGHRSLTFDVAKGILSVKHGSAVSTIDLRIR